MKKIIFAFLATLVLSLSAHSLDLGDKALPISADTWVTGDPADPTKADGKTIYIVEVWSVTCPPCVKSIPILNDIQKRYADQGVKIVSFTSDELSQVKEFLAEHPMEYSSFIDKNGDSSVSYMAADNRTTIPHAFLFDKKGYLVWIGNPLDNIEARVKEVLDGSLTRDTAMAVKDAKQKLQESFERENLGGMIDALKRLEVLEPTNGRYFMMHYSILTDVGDSEGIRSLLTDWYQVSQDQVEPLIILSNLSMDQGRHRDRNPELALAAAKRAFSLNSNSRIEAGLNLADMYKSIGRLDLSLATIKELTKNASPDDIEALSGIENYYTRLVELGKNPDAKYEP